MRPVSHQTIRLAKGKHSSPQHGACVMELASMLAGEPFTDHPRSVSKSIAAFLRAYNDMLDDGRRQDLYAFASKSVGTTASAEVEAARGARLLEWAQDIRERHTGFSLWRRINHHRARAGRRLDPEAAAREAVHAIRKITDETHAHALALVDELIAIGNDTTDSPHREPRHTGALLPAGVAGSGHG